MAVKLSAQCYTVRDEIEKDLWKTIGAMRGMGLNYIEIGGTLGVWPTEFRRRLDDLGLQVSANHASFTQLTTELESVIEENLTVGSRAVILSSVGREQYGQGWAAVAKMLEPIGARLKEADLAFSYHNHAFEFALEDGKPGLDILYETADPSLLSSQLDTYWVAFGGADPAAYIRKMKGRAPHVHLKDGELGVEKPHFLEVGQGQLDWADILAACGEAGVEFGAIEQDRCDRPSLEALKMSVDYLRAHGVTE